MARLVRLDTLRGRCQARASFQGFSNTYPDAEWNDMINEGIAGVYDIIREAFGQGYYRRSVKINTTSTTSIYALPGDFLALISVDATLGGGYPNITMRPYMEPERNRYKNFPWLWFSGYPVWYQLQAQDFSGGGVSSQTPAINFIPDPQGNYVVTCYYVPVPPVLVADGDTFDGVNGWDEWVVCDVACKALTKDGDLDVIAAIREQQSRTEARIRGLAPQRDFQGERVADVVPFDWEP